MCNWVCLIIECLFRNEGCVSSCVIIGGMSRICFVMVGMFR